MIESNFVPQHWVHKANGDKVVGDEAKSCPEVLGFVLSIVLCKLAGDKLPKAREEADPKALLGKDVVVEAMFLQTKLTTQ